MPWVTVATLHINGPVIPVHNSMVTTGKAIAQVSGMPDYPYLTVDYPHVPLAVWTADEITEVAADLAPRIVALLTDGQSASGGAA